MDIIVSVLLGLGIAAFIFFVIQLLSKISKHLRIIRLQLEIQNPLFVSDELLELDQNIQYWHDKMFKFKDDMDDKNKEIRDLTFNLFWAYVERLNHFRIMVAEAKKTGNPSSIHEQNEKWIKKNEEEIRDLEEKAKSHNSKIKEELEKRNLDFEFLGKWSADET